MKSTRLSSSDQKLIHDALEIEKEDAKEAGKLGYMARALAMATIPHRDPKAIQFKRANGNTELTITDLVGNGLPYGSYPRLILAWLTTEAVMKKERTIILGSSLSDFMVSLGLNTDGTTGKQFKTQATKLFSCAFSCSYVDEHHQELFTMPVAKKFETWWHPSSPKQHGIFPTKVKLDQDFFNEIAQSPVPIDLRALKALKRSPMALDIYVWLTYRMSYLIKPTTISWSQLQMQLGADYDDSKRGRTNFQQNFTKHLKSVLTVYPQANVDSLRGVLGFFPRPAYISRGGYFSIYHYFGVIWLES